VPISYEIDRERGLVRTTAVGALSRTELFEHIERLRDDPDLPAQLLEIWDARGIGEVDLQSSDVRMAIELIVRSPVYRQATMAVIATSHVIYGLARMAQALAPWELAVFRDEAEALAWIEHKVTQRRTD